MYLLLLQLKLFEPVESSQLRRAELTFHAVILATLKSLAAKAATFKTKSDANDLIENHDLNMVPNPLHWRICI